MDSEFWASPPYLKILKTRYFFYTDKARIMILVTTAHLLLFLFLQSFNSHIFFSYNQNFKIWTRLSTIYLGELYFVWKNIVIYFHYEMSVYFLRWPKFQS